MWVGGAFPKRTYLGGTDFRVPCVDEVVHLFLWFSPVTHHIVDLLPKYLQLVLGEDELCKIPIRSRASRRS